MKHRLLSRLNLPQDIKKLSPKQEEELCCEIRDKIIETVSQNGGHLSSNLGAVELTVAIHKVFDSPKDKIVFDVGHQSYAHKLLTGRYNVFHTLRKKGGISGFTRPSESEHDACVSGHSSNSISVALGMAQAMKLSGDDHHAIAVIGDGAMTGGLAFEGLNNAGRSGCNIIVILNYNEMSISKNIGGIAAYLSELRTQDTYRRIKSGAKKVIGSIPLIGGGIKSVISVSKDSLKEKLLHSTIFEDFGFQFIGPVDGHNLEKLEAALHSAKVIGGPVLIQVNTIKGKGYEAAEQQPGEYHGVGKFDVKTGEKPDTGSSFSDVFGMELARLAEEDERIIAITAAMKYGTGLNHFKGALRQRLFDVGIAEEHAVSFGAGLSTMGKIPVFSVYSSFLQRSYDELIHDISIPNLHMVIAICNAGIVGEDGETHQGLYDIPFLTTIPNVTIYSPASYDELKLCLNKAIYEDNGLVCVRFPKGRECYEVTLPVSTDYSLTERGSDTLLISYGREMHEVEKASIELGADSLKLTSLWPLQNDIVTIIKRYRKAYVFEECSIDGSVGEKLASLVPDLNRTAISGYVTNMAICEALDLYSLSSEKIVGKVRNDK